MPHADSGHRDIQLQRSSPAAGAPCAVTLERFVEHLISGDRVGCRDLLREFIAAGRDSRDALEHLAWPACALIDRLSRQDQIAAVHEHGAVVLLAQLVQRLECGLAKHPSRCRLVVVTSGRSPSEELAAEIFAGLAEADGFDVLFLGGGVESDDLFAEVARRRPSFLVSFAAAGSDAPRLRRLIDSVRRQDPVPGLRIGVGGGVFERVPGLSDEIGAHFAADSPFDMLSALQRMSERDSGALRSEVPRASGRRSRAA
jgi:methanogenic corrinoid protein MtbC1